MCLTHPVFILKFLFSISCINKSSEALYKKEEAIHSLSSANSFKEAALIIFGANLLYSFSLEHHAVNPDNRY